jgi:hypothetical protein
MPALGVGAATSALKPGSGASSGRTVKPYDLAEADQDEPATELEPEVIGGREPRDRTWGLTRAPDRDVLGTALEN